MAFLRTGLLVGLVTGLLAASCGGTQDVTIEEGGVVADASTDDVADAAVAVTCQASACPGTDTDCSTRSCKDNACAVTATAAGTPLKTQKAGDCRVDQCDGKGAVTSAANDADLPTSGNPCTLEGCKAGVVTSAPAPKGMTCGTALACDGQGACVGCTAPTECPGTDTECQTRTCVANKCGFARAPLGTVVSAQLAGDCMKSQCDGAGNVQAVIDNTDVPVDARPCSADVCTVGVPSNPPLPSGTACAQGNGTVCNGAGVCVQCVSASACPGSDNACRARTCIGNVCGFSFGVAGTKTPIQTSGDCQANQCDGAGNIVSAADNADLPVDANPCTSDVCLAGVPSNPPLPADTACNQGVGTRCNGAGACVQCLVAATCSGSDNACRTRTCNANLCGVTFAAAGTVTPAQNAGDCKVNQCDGAGNIASVTDVADVPVDGNQCTSDSCAGGVPANPPVAVGTACNQGGTVCSGAGTCVQCNVAATCPGVDTECQTRTCALNACGFSFAAAGKVTAAQAAGDCQSNQCNGAGAIVSVAANADVPVDDGNQCTSETCAAGVPAHPPVAAGNACNQSGGVTCDGAGACIP